MEWVGKVKFKVKEQKSPLVIIVVFTEKWAVVTETMEKSWWKENKDGKDFLKFFWLPSI